MVEFLTSAFKSSKIQFEFLLAAFDRQQQQIVQVYLKWWAGSTKRPYLSFHRFYIQVCQSKSGSSDALLQPVLRGTIKASLVGSPPSAGHSAHPGTFVATLASYHFWEKRGGGIGDDTHLVCVRAGGGGWVKKFKKGMRGSTMSKLVQ